MTPCKWILMHFVNHEKITREMPTLLFDSLRFCKDFTLHPSLRSNAIDWVCPLSLSLKETLSRRPRPPFAVVSIILT